MRTILNAENLYKKKHAHYALTLNSLAGTGSVTARMVKSRQRAGYTVGYSFTGESFSLTMTPVTFNPEHRAFYTDSSGLIRVEAEKPATSQSPVLKQK